MFMFCSNATNIPLQVVLTGLLSIECGTAWGENVLNFENLSVDRVIIHQVFKRKPDRQIQQPRYGTALQVLGPEETAVLEDRVVSALGSASKCMGMSLLAVGAGSAFQLARTLIDSDNTLFNQLFCWHISALPKVRHPSKRGGLLPRRICGQSSLMWGEI
jgi:hypothetical protein